MTVYTKFLTPSYDDLEQLMYLWLLLLDVRPGLASVVDQMYLGKPSH